MIRYLLAVASVLLLTAATPPPPPAPAPGGLQIPSVMNIQASVGEVIFLHQAHTKDRSIPCAGCHHQINAKKLHTPHPDYFKASRINCTICHDESGKAKQQVYSCSGCHGANPKNIADETLSAKVVIHKQCWKCHQVSTGKEASTSCQKCHTGKKKF